LTPTCAGFVLVLLQKRPNSNRTPFLNLAILLVVGWAELVAIPFGFALITQRSEVQILPPQSRAANKRPFFFGLQNARLGHHSFGGKNCHCFCPRFAPRPDHPWTGCSYIAFEISQEETISRWVLAPTQWGRRRNNQQCLCGVLCVGILSQAMRVIRLENVRTIRVPFFKSVSAVSPSSKFHPLISGSSG